MRAELGNIKLRVTQQAYEEKDKRKEKHRETINNRQDKTQTTDEKRQELKHSLHKSLTLQAVEKWCSLDHGKFLSIFSLW